MPISLNSNVLVQDGTLLRTDRTGKAVTCSKEQVAQQEVIMLLLGACCDLPKHQLATGFGVKTRQSSDDIRHAVLNGSPADLLPERPGPHHPAKRTQEVEARLIRTRCETDLNRDAIAETLPPMGFTVSARLVGPVRADDGLAKKNGCGPRPAPPDSLLKRRAKSSTAPASHARALSPATTSSTTSPPCGNAG